MKHIFIFVLIFLFYSSVTFSQSWKELNENVAKYYNKGNYESAIEYGEKAVIQAEYEFGMKHENYAISLYNLSILYIYKSEFKFAEKLLNEAIEIFKKDSLKMYEPLLEEDVPCYASSLNNLALIYSYNGDYPIFAKRIIWCCRRIF